MYVFPVGSAPHPQHMVVADNAYSFSPPRAEILLDDVLKRRAKACGQPVMALLPPRFNYD